MLHICRWSVGVGGELQKLPLCLSEALEGISATPPLPAEMQGPPAPTSQRPWAKALLTCQMWGEHPPAHRMWPRSCPGGRKRGHFQLIRGFRDTERPSDASLLPMCPRFQNVIFPQARLGASLLAGFSRSSGQHRPPSDGAPRAQAPGEIGQTHVS